MLKNISLRNKIALAILLVSFVFLFPGVYLSMLTINTQGSVNSVVGHLGIEFFNTSNSILKTVYDLFKQEYYFVSIMIFLFSIIVPVVKSILLIYAIVIKDKKISNQLLNFIKAIAKWSMCDVFVVATFLAFLSTGSRSSGNTHEASILGIPIDINIFVNMSAQLETGFYCFLTYCLLSLCALQLYEELPIEENFSR